MDKAGKPVTLKAGTLQFLTTSRGREGGREGGRNDSSSENEGNNDGQNRANQMDAAKRKEMEMKEQAAATAMETGNDGKNEGRFRRRTARDGGAVP